MIAVITILCLIATGIGLTAIYLALQMERKVAQSIQAEREAWEQAQENARRAWERKQIKRFSEQEQRIADTFHSMLGEWEKIKQQSAERNAALADQYEALERRIRLEQELAALPHVEDVPMGEDSTALLARSHWHPANLRGADIRGCDLSHRYLRDADLRGTQLQDANLFMADLSGANLSGADLCGADLSGANLSGADLRGAILTGANLQVADMQNALLDGANVSSARNLTGRQLATTHLDELSDADDYASLTEPQLPIVRISQNLVYDPPIRAGQTTGSSNGHHEIAHPGIEQLVPETPLPATQNEPITHGDDETVVHDLANDAPLPSLVEDATSDDELAEAAPVSPEFSAQEQLVPTLADDISDSEPEEFLAAQEETPSQDAAADLTSDTGDSSEPVALSAPEPETFPEDFDSSATEPGTFPPPHDGIVPEPESFSGDSAISIENEAHEEDQREGAETDAISYENLLPDLESLLASSTSPQFFAPLAPDDSLPGIHVTDNLVEQQTPEPPRASHGGTHTSKRDRNRQTRRSKR